MKYFKYVCKLNTKFLMTCLLLSLSIDIIVFAIDLPNINVKGFWVPILISLVITVVVMCIALAMVYRVYKKNLPLFKVLDEKGICDELIDTYRSVFPRMNAMNHIVLARQARRNSAGA